ncbi:hypothetical protein ACFSSC_06135 [Corynebacterium mendelii]|uniref:Uncharacterized protein n=1 Tax=Corynebacterium mendelii TaxID=2765362 RepID=A0A939IXY7_9CORY|nr:hypothetical protein [Corynebacterium mendelii]MBN9644558.1 hypothetical protein [Corynebacterium mendelii]
MDHTDGPGRPLTRPRVPGEKQRRLVLAVLPGAVLFAGSTLLLGASRMIGGDLPEMVDMLWYVLQGMVGVFVVGTGFSTKHLGTGYRWLTVVGGAVFAAAALSNLLAPPEGAELTGPGGFIGVVAGVVAPVVGWIIGRRHMAGPTAVGAT